MPLTEQQRERLLNGRCPNCGEEPITNAWTADVYQDVEKVKFIADGIVEIDLLPYDTENVQANDDRDELICLSCGEPVGKTTDGVAYELTEEYR